MSADQGDKKLDLSRRKILLAKICAVPARFSLSRSGTLAKCRANV